MSNKAISRKSRKIIKVVKIGGSCLKEASSFKRIVNLLQKEKGRLALVVSALGGVTDLLLDAYHRSLTQEKDFKGIIAQVQKKHNFLAAELLSPENYRKLEEKFQSIFSQLERILTGLSLARENSLSLKAKILSSGERLSAHLLAAVLEESGWKSQVYETDRTGLIADHVSDEARVNLAKFDLCFKPVAEEVEAGDFIPVFTGFFGTTEDGKTVLFGRNGSDYSAAVIARGLGAKVLITYKDVPGFLSADPAVVPEAKPIFHLTRREASELCYFGAKILHPRVWEPLEDREISVEIRSFYPSSFPGTLITKKPVKAGQIIKSFSVNPEMAVLRIEGPGIGSQPGIIGKIGSSLAAREVNILTVLTSQTCINLLLSSATAETARDVLLELKEPAIRHIHLEKDLALIACVGEGIRESAGVARRIFERLVNSEINLEFFSSGASDVAIYLVIKQKDVSTALRALHAEYFGAEKISSAFNKDNASYLF